MHNTVEETVAFEQRIKLAIIAATVVREIVKSKQTIFEEAITSLLDKIYNIRRGSCILSISCIG